MAGSHIIKDNVLILYAQEIGNYADRFIPYRDYIADITLFNYANYSSKYGISKTEKRILELIKSKNIRIIIATPFATDYQLSPQFYLSLKTFVKIVFIFNDDDNYFHVHSKYISQSADAVVTTDYLSSFEYKRLEIPVIVYMHSCDPNVLHPMAVKKDIDVSFVGDSTKADRPEYIEFLRANGINVSIFGIGSDTGFMPYAEIGKIFCRSKINLNLTRMSEPNWVNYDEPLLRRIRQNKGKPVEIAMTSSFCLSEHAAALQHFFEIGKEVVVFHGKQDLLDKINYYLSHEKEREQIAENAYNRALKDYLNDIGYKRVFTELKAILDNPVKNNWNRVYLSDAFKKKSVNALTFLSFILLKNLRILEALGVMPRLFQYGLLIFASGFYGGVKRSAAHFANLIFRGRKSIYAKDSKPQIG